MAQTFKKLTINGGGVNDTFINPQIAPDFSTSTAYAIGKYVTYQGQTYRFTAAKTAGAWDSTKVTAVNLAGDTDTTLSIAGVAADAKTVGDKFNTAVMRRPELTSSDDANNILTPGVYRKGSAVSVAHWPEALASTTSALIVFSFLSNGTGIQMVSASGKLFWRYNSPTSHFSWSSVPIVDPILSSEGAAADAKAVGDKSFLMRGDLTSSDDADTILTPGCYRKGSTVTVAHWPEELADATSFMLCFVPVYATSPALIQMVSNGSQIFFRYNSATTHGDWSDLTTSESLASSLSSAVMIRSQLTDADDVNTITTAGMYRKGSTVNVANWPSELATTTSELVVLPMLANGTGVQLVITGNAFFWRYNSPTTHWNWRKVSAVGEDTEKVFYVGPTRENTSLIGLFQSLASDTSKKVIYVDPGVYDTYQEFRDNNVPSPPDGTSSSLYEAYNVYVPVNTKVVGLGDVTLKWDPDAADITKTEADIWSPINIHGNIEFENLTVLCNNGRYCVHDDTHNAAAYRGMYHKYKNVRLFRKTKTKGSTTSFLQPTGTALADRCYYEYDNCVFDTDLPYYAWSTHDSPQTYTGRIQQDGATVVFKHCTFNAPNNANAIQLRSGSNPDFVPQKISIDSCWLSGGIQIKKDNTDPDGSYQPYDVSLLNSGAPTISIDSGGKARPDGETEFVPVVRNAWS